MIKAENPCYIKLANSWIVLNSGGGPTPDKPEVLLESLPNLNRVNSFLNLRVTDIWACYKQWCDKGAVFLSEPLGGQAVQGGFSYQEYRLMREYSRVAELAAYSSLPLNVSINAASSQCMTGSWFPEFTFRCWAYSRRPVGLTGDEKPR